MRSSPAFRGLIPTLAGAAVLLGAACGGSAGSSTALPVSATAAVTAAPAPAPRVTLPPVNGRFDYQIGGAYSPAAGVKIVSRDRSEKPVSGKYNICYVNAFQTQPGEAAFWTGSRRSLLLTNRKGAPVIDPDWPDEYILDTSTKARRTAIAAIVNRWIDGCAAAGYQGVEPDNLDSWTRSKKLLTKADNVALATLLARHAHRRGLAIAQKNTAELGRTGRSTIGFDFAIAEECQVYNECGEYTGPYGKNVIEIEYTDNPRSAWTRACAAQGRTISVILRDRDVLTKGRPGYRYEAC
jgi:hypothetical protein